jgi:hypothetical protein
VVVSPEQADLVFTIEFPVPTPVAWHYLTDPGKKSQAFSGFAIFSPQARPGGRNGPGASNHCAHGKDYKGSTIETFLDWRPFDYLTVESVEGKLVLRETYQFEPTADGQKTRLEVLTQIVTLPLPRWLKRIFVKLFVAKKLTMPYYAIAQLMAKESVPETLDITPQPVA